METRSNYRWTALSDVERLRYLTIWADGKTPSVAVATFFNTDEGTLLQFLRQNAPHLLKPLFTAMRPRPNIDHGPVGDDYPPFNYRKRR